MKRVMTLLNLHITDKIELYKAQADACAKEGLRRAMDLQNRKKLLKE